jgi:hypothetical protein
MPKEVPNGTSFLIIKFAQRRTHVALAKPRAWLKDGFFGLADLILPFTENNFIFLSMR